MRTSLWPRTPNRCIDLAMTPSCAVTLPGCTIASGSASGAAASGGESSGDGGRWSRACRTCRGQPRPPQRSRSKGSSCGRHCSTSSAARKAFSGSSFLHTPSFPSLPCSFCSFCCFSCCASWPSSRTSTKRRRKRRKTTSKIDRHFDCRKTTTPPACSDVPACMRPRAGALETRCS